MVVFNVNEWPASILSFLTIFSLFFWGCFVGRRATCYVCLVILKHHANRHHRITRIPRKMEITKVARVKTKKASLVTLGANNRSQMAFGGGIVGL